MRAKSSDVHHRGHLNDQWVNANIRFSHKGSLFPTFNQQQSVICFSMSVSLLCYDNLMQSLVAEETKVSPGEQKQHLNRRHVRLIVIKRTETRLGKQQQIRVLEQ